MDRDLQAFLTIARQGNITAAAQKLRLAQPTLTKRLQNLEAKHDCKLVERLPRGVRLTQFGEMLLPHAERIERDYLQADEEIRSVSHGHLDRLGVGAGPYFQQLYLGAALHRLMGEFPDTNIHFNAAVNSFTLPKLRKEELDIVFGGTEHLSDDDHILFHQLATVEMGLITRVGHPVVRSSKIDSGKLGDLPWVDYTATPGGMEVVRSHFRRLGMPPPKIAVQTTSILFGMQIVAESDCLMALPVELGPTLDKTKLQTCRTLPPICMLPTGAHTRRSSMQYPIITRLVELVAEAIDA